MSKEQAARISNAVYERGGKCHSEDVAGVTASEFAEGDLPDSCFAYVPSGGNKSDRKLPLCGANGQLDSGHVGAAAAALGKGFRGQKVDLPSGERSKAIGKVRSAWKKLHPDSDPEDMPDVLKASEVFADDEERPTREYLSALWTRLKEMVGAEKLSRDDFDAAHRAAMSSAGGTRRAKKRKEDAATYREHVATHPESIQGCELCDPIMEIAKLPKADARVQYREGEGGETCYGCRFYRWGSCALVEGGIEAGDLCNLYLAPLRTVPEPASTVYGAAGDGGSWRLFVEQERFADAPEWINVLPVPGLYTHPSYGQIAITPERNRRFVTNFQNKVYQQDLPITLDIEHDGKLSGAVGYLAQMRVNDDGSADAKVMWTDRGKSLIEEDAFRYFSPELLTVWREPVSGAVYEDVLIGGALCTRPFFKESALRPLVASEGALYAPEGSERDPTVIVLRPLAAKEQAVMGESVTLTEEEVQKFREAETERETLKAQVAQFAEEKKASDEKIGKLEADAATKRFTELVMGRGEAGDGAVWAGGIQENVESLRRLATVFGEDSAEFAAEVKHRQTVAKQLKESGLFTPIGTSEGGEGGTAWEQIEAKAQKYAEEHNVSHEEAVGAVALREPGLYAAYRRGE